MPRSLSKPSSFSSSATDHVVSLNTSTSLRQSSIQSFFPSKKRLVTKRKLSIYKENSSPTTPLSERTNIKTTTTGNKSSSSATKKAKRSQQLYLDLGQKDFCKQIECQVCGLLYVKGEPEDESQHRKVCKDYVQGVPFAERNARLVWSRKAESIVEIRSSDSLSMRRKVDQVRLIVDKELGFVPSEDDDRHHSLNTFLYIVDKRVVGMASAEPITEAYILSDNNRERTTRHKAMVGIHQLWVHGKFRKRGIATRLVDTVRERMVFGVIVPSEQVAFSSPTVAGACFARQYLLEMSSKNSVLVYDCR